MTDTNYAKLRRSYLKRFRKDEDLAQEACLGFWVGVRAGLPPRVCYVKGINAALNAVRDAGAKKRGRGFHHIREDLVHLDSGDAGRTEAWLKLRAVVHGIGCLSAAEQKRLAQDLDGVGGRTRLPLHPILQKLEESAACCW